MSDRHDENFIFTYRIDDQVRKTIQNNLPQFQLPVVAGDSRESSWMIANCLKCSGNRGLKSITQFGSLGVILKHRGNVFMAGFGQDAEVHDDARLAAKA